jgi:hypothetical protein
MDQDFTTQENIEEFLYKIKEMNEDLDIDQERINVNDFLNSANELSGMFMIDLPPFSWDNFPEYLSFIDTVNAKRKFIDLENAAKYYGEAFDKLYKDETNKYALSIFGYIMGHNSEIPPMILSSMMFELDENLKNQKDEIDYEEFENVKNIKAEEMSKIALSCLEDLYPIIKRKIGDRPLLAGELLLILEYMKRISLPHMILKFFEDENMIEFFENITLNQPIDDMFSMLNESDYEFDDKNNRCIIPKLNIEPGDNCACYICNHRRLRAKYKE